MSDLLLVLDQGGHSSRAALFDGDGELLQLQSEPVATARPRASWVEQDPRQLLDSLRRSLDRIEIPAGHPTRAALVTQRSSLVCWDRDSGDPLSPVLSWQDTRGADLLASYGLDPDGVRQHTGLYPSAHFGASKIRWCLDQLPAVQRAYREQRLCVGPLASYLLQGLLPSQPPAVDPANASRTLLYHIQHGDWDPELLALFDIPVEILPAIQPNFREWGPLRVGDVELPLQLVTGDQCAAIALLGRQHPHTAVVNAGTGAFIAKPLAQGCAPSERLLATLLWQRQTPSGEGGDRAFIIEGTVNGAASALQWAAEQLSLVDYERLDRWALEQRSPPLFLNGVGGLGSPFWAQNFASRFEGDGSAEAKMVAVLESIVFLLKCNLQQLCSSGDYITHLRVAGGLSRYRSFCQKLADVTGLSVQRAEVGEATAQGAAWLLAGQPRWRCHYQRFAASGDSDAIKARYDRWCETMIAALNQTA